MVAVTSLTLGTTACDAWYNGVPSPDDLMHHIAWFDHMIYQRTVDAYGTVNVPRYTPAGSVPIKGGQPSWRVGDPASLQYGFDTLVANHLANPTLPGATGQGGMAASEVAHIPAALEARGDTLFTNYCSACHGINGVPYTDPKIPTVGLKIGAPSLLTERARKYTDGYLYSMVRYGRGVMPQYGDKIYDPMDRWAVVNHVRKLQAAAPMTATVGGEH
jgi:mono/diheme cytochrome c family protein